MRPGSTNVLGVVVAGGLSRRMGAQDKLWIDLEGEPLISRAARRLGQQADNVILNVNSSDARLEAFGLPVVPDLHDDNQGPLAGIHASLRWARDNRPDITHVIGASVDSPFFPDDLVSCLTADLAAHPDQIAIAFYDGYPQPVFGLWPCACLDALNSFLETTDNLKVMAFVKAQPWRRVDFPASSPPAFFNINTPDDLSTARQFLERETLTE